MATGYAGLRQPVHSPLPHGRLSLASRPPTAPRRRQLFTGRGATPAAQVLDPSEFGALAETAGLRDKFGAIVERRKEQLTGKWMVARRTVLGREAHLVM